MRFQIVVSLALLQLSSSVAAASASGSNKMVGASSSHSSDGSHGTKPQGGHGASMGGSKSGASSGQGAHTKGKAVPRMETFSDFRLSPVDEGVVNPLGSATLDKRTVPSASSKIPNFQWPECSSSSSSYGGIGENLPKRCFDQYIQDSIPIPIDGTVGSEGSTTNDASATTEKRSVPSGLGSSVSSACPIIGRRGDFLVRRCFGLEDNPLNFDPEQNSYQNADHVSPGGADINVDADDWDMN